MRYMVAILLLCSGYQSCLQLDVVLLVDTSASVFNSQGFINEAISGFRRRFIGTDVHIAVITFDDRGEVRAHLGDTTFVAVFPHGSTNLEDGLRLAVNELYGLRGRDVGKIVVVISDGEVDERYACAARIRQVRRMGVKFFGVQVGGGNSFLQETCDVFMESDYEILASELKRMDVCL